MCRFKACVSRYHCIMSKETNKKFRVEAVHEKTEASVDNSQTQIVICCAEMVDTSLTNVEV